MEKYTFLVYHKEYQSFLKEIQKLGALHIIEKEDKEVLIAENNSTLKSLNKAIDILEKRESPYMKCGKLIDSEQLISEILSCENTLVELIKRLDKIEADILKLKPWGDYDPDVLKEIGNCEINVGFFVVDKENLKKVDASNCYYEIISESKTSRNLVVFFKKESDLQFDREEIKLPQESFDSLEKQKKELSDKINSINIILDDYAATSISCLKKIRNDLYASIEFQKVLSNSLSNVNEKVKVLEGWIPETKKSCIDNFLNENNILHVAEKASVNDNVPILLKNNKFSKLFEPIGKLFSLPSYTELDLTSLFAPFFMMFFGFCLGDAGYGLLFLIGAGLYKLKAKKEIKPMLTLIQVLGLATMVFGAISGTFFGVNLITSEIEIVSKVKHLFFDSDKMFTLALILGSVQIVFGILVKAVNQTKQFGFKHALATLGWLFLILASITYMGLINLGYLASNKFVWYSILTISSFFILLFSDMEVGVFSRIGKGLWDVYSTITGLFGDLLSYIRLFALGLSSAILGFVINDIALQILNSNAIIGPIFFVVFLLLGHGLNILISSLGSFVHPMRLTFVEFYKNAGFKGGGKEYNPFSEKIIKN